MSNDINVRSVSKARVGSTPRVDEALAPIPELSLEEASERWKHLRSEVKDLPWSGVPDQMLRDFLIAGTGTIRQSYGSNAPTKAAEVFAIQVLSRGAVEATIHAAWPQAGASASFALKTHPLSATNPVATTPGTEFVLDGPAGQTEEELRRGLAEWADKEQPETRFVLNPITQVPPDGLRNLVKQVEGLMGDPLDATNQFDALLVASSLLIMWKELEDMNAEVSSTRMSGLSDGHREVASGLEVMIESKRVALDYSVESPTSTRPRAEYSVRTRPS